MQKRPLRNFGHKKYVPFTEVEWKYAQRKFQSENLKDLQRVVALMAMWISRMQHDTPVIIGISEMVLHAILNGRKLDIGTASMERADLGLIYGSTITRFINYVNEVCQDETKNLSIAYAVSKMGIPSWVVNIRHQATHGQMPPLNLMKEAILFCRQWLWRTHWSLPFNVAIKENLSHKVVEEHREAIRTITGHRLITAMGRFREWRKRYRSLDHFHSSEGSPVEKVRIDIEQLLEQRANEFLLFFAKSCLAPSSSAATLSFMTPPKNNNNNIGDGGGDQQQNALAFDENGDELPSTLFCIDEDDAETTSGCIIVDDADDVAANGERAELDDGNDDVGGCRHDGCGSSSNNNNINGIIAATAAAKPIPLSLKCDVMSRQKFIDEITGMEQNYYRPIFILINNKGYLQRLLVELTRLVSQGELAFGELRRLAGWANLLLHAYLETADSVSMQNWRLILKHAVLSPQFFKDEHIDKLLHVLGDSINDQCRRRLVHLLKISRCSSVAPSSSSLTQSQQQKQHQQNGGSDHQHLQVHEAVEQPPTGGGRVVVVKSFSAATMAPTIASTQLDSNKASKKVAAAAAPAYMINNRNNDDEEDNDNNNNNILDMSMQSVKSLSDLQERIRSEDLADTTFVRDPLTLEDAWSIAQPEELGPLGLTADQRPDTLCLTLGEWGDEMRRSV